MYRRFATVSMMATVATRGKATFGAPLPTKDVAAKFHMTVDQMLANVKPQLRIHTEMELARQHFAALLQHPSSQPLFQIADKVASTPRSLAPVAGGKQKLHETAFKSLEEVVTAYEEIMFPIRNKREEFLSLQLTSFHIKDDLKRGLTAFKQAYLDKEAARLKIVLKDMAACEAFITKAVADAFSTDFCNNLVNVLRIAGERDPAAHTMAMRVLDDMSLHKIPFSEFTQVLLRVVLFGDKPFEDSSLLFSCIEYPELGEISASKEPLSKIADDVLKTVSARHQTPLDDGQLLHQADTYPCLQRSPE